MPGQPNPSFNLTVNTQGLPPATVGGGNTPLIIGNTQSGDPSGDQGVGLYSFADLPTMTATLGSYGNAIDAAALDFSANAQSVLLYKAFIGTVNAGNWAHVGAGSGTIAVSGNLPLGAYGTPTGSGSTGIIIQVTTASNGTLYGQFNYSLDGGVSWSSPQNIVPTSPQNLGTTGVSVVFTGADTVGVWDAGDTYVQPITAAVGLMYPYGSTSFNQSLKQTTSTGSTSVTGGGTFTDNSSNPLDNFYPLIVITATGTSSAGTAQYVYSLDGGITFSAPQVMPSGSAAISLPGGISLTPQDTNTQASLNVPSTTGGDGILWTAVPVGAAGNLIKIVQNSPSGGSSTAAITHVGGYTVVTISPKTSETNSGLITAIAASVATYITGVATGGSDDVIAFSSAPLAGGVGGGGITSGFVAGERYSWGTQGPQMTPALVASIIESLQGNPNTWGWIHIAQQANTVNTGATNGFELSTLFTDVEAAVGLLFGAGQYVGAYALYDGPINTSQQNIDSTYEAWAATAAGLYSSVGTGNAAATVSPANGWQLPRGSSWDLSARCCSAPLGQDPAWIGAGPLVGVNSSQLYRNEASTPGLGPAGFVCLWTVQGEPGVYITNGNLLVASDNDISLTQDRRIINAACAAARRSLIGNQSGSVRLTSTGQIDPRDLANLQTNATQAVLAALNGQISSAAVVISPTLIGGDEMTVNVGITELGYLKKISVTVGLVNPALAA